MELWDYAELPQEELIRRIKRAKEEKGAVILAHNYQRPEIQELADFLGDSLQLARKATEIDADIIVFCGVLFMAEVAAILNPDKKVLIPEIQAGCPLAACAAAEDVMALKKKYPDYAVVTYVNSSAEVKAVSDIVCTSANAVKVVESFPRDRGIIFVPDRNLCDYVKRQTGRQNIVCWPGNCYVHDRMTPEDVIRARNAHPEATVIVHPECPPEVQQEADLVFSTGGMYRYVKEHPGDPVVLGTEIGMVHRLNREFPETPIYPMVESAVCANMKLITLPKLARSLEEEIYEVKVPESVAERAKRAIERMLEVR